MFTQLEDRIMTSEIGEFVIAPRGLSPWHDSNGIDRNLGEPNSSEKVIFGQSKRKIKKKAVW